MSGTDNYTVKSAAATDAGDAANAKAITDLTARVAKLEAGGTKPPVQPTESPEGITVPPAASIADALGNVFTITASKQVGINGTADAATSNVTQEYYHSHHMVHQNTAGNWYQATMSGGPPGGKATYAQVASPVPVPPGPAGHFSVSLANGFRDSAGTKWELRGYNCWWGEYGNIKANLFAKFPGANLVRVVMDRNTTVANVQPMITELTGRKMVCIIDYHDSVYAGTTGWYQTMTAAFKDNALCLMETPNEPGGAVASDQISIINTLRAAGWTNPIGIELIGGYIFDNVKPVMGACAQNNQLFLCPHNYGNWWDSMRATCNGTGLYSVVDEFGDSMDGSNIDSNGAACVQHVCESQMRHECGAALWSSTNGYHEGDNLFADPHGNTLTSMGRQITDLKFLA